MVKLVFAATLLLALVSVSLPLQAAEQGSVSFNVCNAGKVDLDVFLSTSGKVSSSHIGPADCALVAKSEGSMGATYVGLAFVDSKGQWGAARRLDLLPDFGGDSLAQAATILGDELAKRGLHSPLLQAASKPVPILDTANQNASVRHGSKDVSLPMQLLFQPPTPKCGSSSADATQSYFDTLGMSHDEAQH